MDSRVKRLANLLVHYSLKLKKGDLLRIDGETVSLPLIKAVYKEALNVGAHPYTQIRVQDNQEAFYNLASEEQMKFISPISRLEVNKLDALLTIWGHENTRALSGVDPKRQGLVQRYQRPLFEQMMKRMGDGSLSWCGTQYPTLADAQDAEMSLEDYAEFVFRAGHVHKGDPVRHWKKVAAEQDRLIGKLDRVDRLHFTGAGTDLRMSVKGRKWINCAGTKNFPDGEIFSSPIENTVEGHISFSFPAVYQGKEVQKVRLEFKKGIVVKEFAEKNLAYLRSMLDADEGARRVGEIAIGTNYEIKRFSRNTLFDEKIGGTCHLAVGASIPEAGGRNRSAIHWDMVCDLKKGGEIEADGKIIYRNGKFLI